MRDSSTWKKDIAKTLRREPDAPEGRAVLRLIDVELVLYLFERVARDQSVFDAWALLGGYPFLSAGGTPVANEHESMICVARHLVLWFKDREDWRTALEEYVEYPESIRGYKVDLVAGTASQRVPTVLADRFDCYQDVLSSPPPDLTSKITVAGPGRYFNQAEPATSVTIPDWFPSRPADRGHDVLARRDREPIELKWSDLVAAAQWGDDREAALQWPATTRSNWVDRLTRVTLEVRQADNSFSPSKQLTISGIMHMIGMVGAGKTTLVEVLLLWCHLNNRRVCVIADNVTAVLRKTVRLQALGIRAAPVLGQSNRVQHLTRLHRLTNPRNGRIAPAADRMFDLTSTACALDGLRDHSATPWDLRHAPCSGLIPETSRDSSDGKPQVQACPAWHTCQRHEPSRDLVDATVWVATTASLIHTPLPKQLNEERLRYLELVWRRSDLIIVDEADQVQAQLDSMFSPEQQLIGEDYDAWLDEVIDRTKKTIRQSGREPMHEPLVRHWLVNLDNANIAVDIMYSSLSRDRARPQPALSRRWLDKAYFTEWTLTQQLAQSWAGFGPATSNSHRPVEGWEGNPTYRRLRAAFNDLIDDPLGAKDTDDALTQQMIALTAQVLRDANESVRLRRVGDWLEAISKELAEQGLTLAIDDLERQAVRLEFTLAVAVLAKSLDHAMDMFRAVEMELGLEGTSSALFHRAPTDYQPVVPDSPMGNVLGFQYLDDDDQRKGRSKMGRLRFFRCSGIGRWVLLHLHNLFRTDSNHGPNVLLLSGTSWAGTSARYHIDIPVTAVLTPPQKELAAVRASRFEFFPLFAGDTTAPIKVSGKFGEQRELALRQMIAELANPGAGKSILEQHRDSMPTNRQRLLLLVGSYPEARMVAQHLVSLRSSWQDQVLHLVADDEEFTDSWDGANGLRRGDVHTLAQTSAWILVAPLLAVERGHNILNDDSQAAIGAAYFLVRPHPRPDDLSYVIQRVNRWATHQIRHGFPAVEGADRAALGRCAAAFRSAGHRQWRWLLNLKLAYSNLPVREREALAWTQLVTIWQVIGRLVRGGVPAEVYFCDAAFAPNAARRSDNTSDDASLSLLIGLRDVLAPYFVDGCTDPDTYLVETLYGCLYEALARLEGL